MTANSASGPEHIGTVPADYRGAAGHQAAPEMLRGPAPFVGGGASGSGGAEQRMVPRAEFRDYYGLPVIKAPAWAARDIAGYFFLGGLAGAGSVLAAGAHRTGRPVTAKALKVSSLAGVGLATAALINDLGRPARFGNMLRVVKPTSPMNVGSWLLAVYGPAAGLAAASGVTGLLPRVGGAATHAAAVLGPAVATYTAVLAADTAVPVWHGAHRELPYLFAASATAAASGMALLAGPVRENGPARGIAVLAAVADRGAELAVRRRLGTQTAGHQREPDGSEREITVADTLSSGRAGRLLRAARALTGAGAVAAGVAGRHRGVAALAGLALLAGSAATRFGVFAAGVASAEDPRYTVGPQRARLAARAETEPREPAPDGQRD